MIFEYATRRDKSGNRYYLGIDNETFIFSRERDEMKKTIKAGEGTKKYNLFLHKKFKLHNGVWHSWHNNEYQPFWTTPKTHRAHIMHLKQIMAR